MTSDSNAFLGTQPMGRLMRKFAVPCVVSLLFGALYNIVDQIFIANADYLGSYGNASNSVVFPLTVIALALATMLGDGCCALVSLSLGAGHRDDARRSVGTAVVTLVLVSLILTAVYLIWPEQILTMFGARKRRNLPPEPGILLLYRAGRALLHRRSGAQSHHTLGRQPALCDAHAARGRADQLRA